MNILYITNEAPFFPSGGIATYLGYAARGMQKVGHNVFILCWLFKRPSETIVTDPFPPSNVKIVTIDLEHLQKLYPGSPQNHAIAAFLQSEIAFCVDSWGIDVVEAADYLSPAVMFFQQHQNSRNSSNVLCTTFNHGFIQDFYDADQINPSTSAADDLVGERLQCRVSDLIIAPSKVSAKRVAHYSIQTPVSIVREPYVFDYAVVPSEPRLSITYIGRVAISKGIDKIIQVVNNIDSAYPIDQILLIGRLVDTPFRVSDMKEYVFSRIAPRLREKVIFAGFLPRNLARSLLQPGAFCPSLGSAETFSYACIESIDSGLIPIVRANTPMAEFFPEHLTDYILEENLGSSKKIIKAFDKLMCDSSNVMKDVIDFNKDALDPYKVSMQISDLYEDGLRKKKRILLSRVDKKSIPSDVTILMPAYNPNSDFFEAIDSLACQTAQSFKLHICDDGSSDESRLLFDYALMRIENTKIIKQPNNGLLGARTTLIDSLETKFAIFLDADDILAPDYIESMLQIYDNNIFDANAVLCSRLNFGESEEAVIRNYFEDYVHLMRNDFRMTGLIESDVLREIGFNPTRRNGEGDDWIFWLYFFAKGFKLTFSPEMKFRYRFKLGSMSWPWSSGQSAGTMSMIREAAELLCKHRPDKTNNLALALQVLGNEKNF